MEIKAEQIYAAIGAVGLTVLLGSSYRVPGQTASTVIPSSFFGFTAGSTVLFQSISLEHELAGLGLAAVIGLLMWRTDLPRPVGWAFIVVGAVLAVSDYPDWLALIPGQSMVLINNPVGSVVSFAVGGTFAVLIAGMSGADFHA